MWSKQAVWHFAVAVLACAFVLHVRVAPAQAGSMRQVPVPAFTIYPGDTIAEGAIVDRALNRPLPEAGAFYDDPSAVVGKVARRTLIAGQPIPLDAARAPSVVTQGQTVTLQYSLESLTITGAGLALQSGRIGDLIRVRNADSGRVVHGRVLDARIVSVGAP